MSIQSAQANVIRYTIIKVCQKYVRNRKYIHVTTKLKRYVHFCIILPTIVGIEPFDLKLTFTCNTSELLVYLVGLTCHQSLEACSTT